MRQGKTNQNKEDNKKLETFKAGTPVGTLSVLGQIQNKLISSWSLSC